VKRAILIVSILVGSMIFGSILKYFGLLDDPSPNRGFNHRTLSERIDGGETQRKAEQIAKDIINSREIR